MLKITGHDDAIIGPALIWGNGTRISVLVYDAEANRYAHSVEIVGPSKVVYSPDKALSCGAHVWIETYAEVLLHGEP